MYGNYGNNRGYGGGRDDRDFGRTPPVNEGEEFDVRIEAVGEKGDGVAKKDGFVLFVPNVKEGDEVRIKVTKVLRKVGFAEVTGQAQGPIASGESSSPKPRSAAAEKAAEIREVEQNAQKMEDSEDFGDEEAPAEPVVEEEPVAESEVAEEPVVEEAPVEEPAAEPAIEGPEAPAEPVVEEEPVEEPVESVAAPEEPEAPAEAPSESAEEPSTAPVDPAEEPEPAPSKEDKEKQQF